jgi:hypothetical protein
MRARSVNLVEITPTASCSSLKRASVRDSPYSTCPPESFRDPDRLYGERCVERAALFGRG